MSGSMQIHKVSLEKVWGVPGLPEVFFQVNTSSQGRSARLSSEGEIALASQPWLPLNAPVKLLNHREAKPWGSEIWYTGIEKRGVCDVQFSSGHRLSLPAYLTLLTHAKTRASETIPAPSLLKILDPLPDPSRGSLYIEVHREKWETYIVSGVDKNAWPTGEGEVLFGFSSEKITQFNGDSDSFLVALQADVEKYEKVRRRLDGETLEPQRPDDIEREKQLWQTVRSYFGILKVTVGSVIEVPPFTPHSLQHGVRVVEFQTPTYERWILAFNQQVQTQKHWDTFQALAAARFQVGTRQLQSNSQSEEHLLPTPQKDPKHAANLGWKRIVDFPQFKVFRTSLNSGDSIAVELQPDASFTIVFVVSGLIQINSRHGEQLLALSAEEAALVPADAVIQGLELLADPASPALVLAV